MITRKPWLVDPLRLPPTESVSRTADEAEQRAHRELKRRLGDSYVYEKVRLEDFGGGPRGYVAAKQRP